MNVIDRLTMLLNKSKPGDAFYNIIECLLANIFLVEDFNIYQMAELCATSPATISRLCRQIGFNNFYEFKSNLSASVNGYSNLNRSMPFVPSPGSAGIIGLYHKTMQDAYNQCVDALDPGYIDKLIEDMGAYDRFYFMALRPANMSSFQQDLWMAGKRAYYTNTLEGARKTFPTLDQHCFIISTIPKLNESVDMIQLLKGVRETGATTLIVSAALLSQYEKYADYILSFPGTGTSMDQYCVNFCMNVLMMAYRARYID